MVFKGDKCGYNKKGRFKNGKRSNKSATSDLHHLYKMERMFKTYQVTNSQKERIILDASLKGNNNMYLNRSFNKSLKSSIKSANSSFNNEHNHKNSFSNSRNSFKNVSPIGKDNSMIQSKLSTSLVMDRSFNTSANNGIPLKKKYKNLEIDTSNVQQVNDTDSFNMSDLSEVQ
jgi:hypothetical protein